MKYEVLVETCGQQIDLVNFEGTFADAIEVAWNLREYWEGEGYKQVRALVNGEEVEGVA